MTNNKRKTKILILIGFLVLLALLMLFLFSGDNFDLLRSLFLEEHTNEELQEKLAAFGWRGYITIVILSMLQVVITFLPAEPVQVLAGLTFGFPIGLACCTVGVFLGNTAIYIFYYTLGNKVREYFVKNLHLDFDKAAKSKKSVLIIFILYFLPAIPYGMICFLAASMGMKYPRFITVTLLGAIPSVCIGVGLGHMAIASSWIVSVIVFSIIIGLLIIVMMKKDAIFARVNAYIDRPPYSSQTTVKKYRGILFPVASFVTRIIFFFKGVKMRCTSKLTSELQTPSIVLCTHGSFIDFVYAGSLIRKKHPNFIVARLYFYKKIFGSFLRHIGCFPKSMFAQDIESAKNCARVLKAGGVLAMMPEARLSTVGEFEGIKSETFDLIKSAGVPVYTIKIQGSYFAKPKWGTGLRRGALIEAELEELLCAEDIANMSVEEIKGRVEERLYYNDFEWIKTKPKVRYRSKRLAEGLENILSTCPKCKEKYTIKTKCRDIFCERCGKLATVNDRYSFAEGALFRNFADWYNWQSDLMKAAALADPEYVISAEVELRMPSLDGKTMLRTVGEGECFLHRHGLLYVGTLDGQNVRLRFSADQIYRLLFGAGEDFELYVHREIYYFVPKERRCAVDWYILSGIFEQMRAEKKAAVSV